MRRLLIVGCGDMALRVIPLLTPHYRVYALVRNTTYRAKLRAMAVTPILGDLDDRRSLVRLAGLADTLLHFAPPPNTGNTDTRTRNLLSALSQRGKSPRHMVYISTSGVYGDCAGSWVSETHPLNATSPRSLRRVDAELQVRRWASGNRVNASILRVPGIYAEDRLPLNRIRQGTPGIVDAEDSYTNHIHADDLARISIAALRHGAACRIYHSSDDSHLKMGQYFDCVADAFGLPRVPRVSRDEAQRVLPETLLSFMNESRLLLNQRMKRELKVRLRYPAVHDALSTIVHP